MQWNRCGYWEKWSSREYSRARFNPQ